MSDVQYGPHAGGGGGRDEVARIAIECTVCKKVDSCEEGKPLPRCYDCLSPTRLSETAQDISDDDIAMIDELVEDFFSEIDFIEDLYEEDDDDE